MAQSLAGGHKAGDKLYYHGASTEWVYGDKAYKLVHGQLGDVAGPGPQDGRLAIKFTGNTDNIDCPLNVLGAAPPWPLPGGHKAGDKLYYHGVSQEWGNGDKACKLVHGQPGEVAGPGAKDGSVSMKFPGNPGNVDCGLHELGAAPPGPLPAGDKFGGGQSDQATPPPVSPRDALAMVSFNAGSAGKEALDVTDFLNKHGKATFCTAAYCPQNPGGNWQVATNSGVANAKVLIMLITKGWMASEECQEESKAWRRAEAHPSHLPGDHA